MLVQFLPDTEIVLHLLECAQVIRYFALIKWLNLKAVCCKSSDTHLMCLKYSLSRLVDVKFKMSTKAYLTLRWNKINVLLKIVMQNSLFHFSSSTKIISLVLVYGKRFTGFVR